MIDKSRFTIAMKEFSTDLICLTMVQTVPDSTVTKEENLFLNKNNVVGFHASLEKPGLTTVYTDDCRVFLVKETPLDILMMK